MIDSLTEHKTEITSWMKEMEAKMKEDILKRLKEEREKERRVVLLCPRSSDIVVLLFAILLNRASRYMLVQVSKLMVLCRRNPQK